LSPQEMNSDFGFVNISRRHLNYLWTD